MLKKLDIFLLKSYTGPLVATFFISVFVLLMQFLWKYIDELVGKGLDFSVIAELMFHASVTLVPMALPLAILLASIMTFGNLGEKFELTAIKASGISLQRVMKPLVVLTLLISVGAFYVANSVIPYANLKMSALLWSIKTQRPELNIKPNVFNNDIENYSIRISHKNPVTNMMYDFVVYDHSPSSPGDYGGGDNRSVIIADSGSMKMTENNRYMIVTLYNGVRYEEEKEKVPQNYPHRKDEFDMQTMIFDLSGLDFNRTDENLFKNNYQMKNITELDNSTDSLQFIFDKRASDMFENLSTSYYMKQASRPEHDYAIKVRANRVYKAPINNLSLNDMSINDVDERILQLDTSFRREDSIIRLQIAAHTDSVYNELYAIAPAELQVVMDLDSVVESLNRDERLRVMDETKRMVNETNGKINDRNEDFTNRLKTIAKYRNAWHQKFTLSLACILFFFVGAPLGAIIRKGGFGLPIVVSVLVFIIYYLISTAGMKMARDGLWESWQGMWLSTLVILPFGVFLTYKATVDAPLFESDFWKNLFSPIAKWFKRKSDDGDDMGDR